MCIEFLFKNIQFNKIGFYTVYELLRSTKYILIDLD